MNEGDINALPKSMDHFGKQGWPYNHSGKTIVGCLKSNDINFQSKYRQITKEMRNTEDAGKGETFDWRFVCFLWATIFVRKITMQQSTIHDHGKISRVAEWEAGLVWKCYESETEIQSQVAVIKFRAWKQVLRFLALGIGMDYHALEMRRICLWPNWILQWFMCFMKVIALYAWKFETYKGKLFECKGVSTN